jgi:Leucine-rich repeat (LRR) protein
MFSLAHTHSKKAFEGLLQLLTLNLSRNAIEHIPTDAFLGLVSLRKMDLSHNFLEKLDNKTTSVFEDCLSLQDVRMMMMMVIPCEQLLMVVFHFTFS